LLLFCLPPLRHWSVAISICPADGASKSFQMRLSGVLTVEPTVISGAFDESAAIEPPLNSSGAKPSGDALGGVLLKASDYTKAITTKGKTATKRGAAKPMAEPAATRSDSRYAPHAPKAPTGGACTSRHAAASGCLERMPGRHFAASLFLLYQAGLWHAHPRCHSHPRPLCCSSACCPSIGLSPHPPSASVPLTAPVRASRCASPTS
jgi:hypothetical protein